LKIDKLEVTPENLPEMDEYYHFGRRLLTFRWRQGSGSTGSPTGQKERSKVARKKEGYYGYFGGHDIRSRYCFLFELKLTRMDNKA
jgi:hypothetical protein